MYKELPFSKSVNPISKSKNLIISFLNSTYYNNAKHELRFSTDAKQFDRTSLPCSLVFPNRC